METSTPTIDWQTANHVLNYFYADEGMNGGSFSDALLNAFSKADEPNKFALGRGFPVVYAAWQLAALSPSGIDTLRVIANRAPQAVAR